MLDNLTVAVYGAASISTLGGGSSGLDVASAALGALGRFDQEHAAVYFQIIYNALREPLQRALEALIMELQSEGKATFPPFAQQLIDRGKLEGKLEGKRDVLLRLLARTGISLTESDRRIGESAAGDGGLWLCALLRPVD